MSATQTSNGHTRPMDPWQRLRQLREAELEAQREWESAHEEEQRLKRAWRAAQARTQAFMDTGQDECPLFPEEDTPGPGPRMPSRFAATDRPLPVSVDGGPASTEGATAEVPFPPVRVPANVTDPPCAACGKPIPGTVYHLQGQPERDLCRPCWGAARPPAAPNATTVTALFPAGEQDRWPAGLLPSQALKAKVRTVADALRLDPSSPPKGLSPAQCGALLDAAEKWLAARTGAKPAPACLNCGVDTGGTCDLPSQYHMDDDLCNCDVIDIDLLDLLPEGKRPTPEAAPDVWLCGKCHGELMERHQAAQEPAPKPQKNRKAKAAPARGVCRVCGCVEADCSGCIARTGLPCGWTSEAQDLCSACLSLLEVELGALPEMPRQALSRGGKKRGVSPLDAAGLRCVGHVHGKTAPELEAMGLSAGLAVLVVAEVERWLEDTLGRDADGKPIRPGIAPPTAEEPEPERQITVLTGAGELKPATCSVNGCKKPAAIEVTHPIDGSPGVVSKTWLCERHRGQAPEAGHDHRDVGRWSLLSGFAGVTERMARLMAEASALRTVGDVLDRAAALKQPVPDVLALVKCLNTRAREVIAAACATAAAGPPATPTPAYSPEEIGAAARAVLDRDEPPKPEPPPATGTNPVTRDTPLDVLVRAAGHGAVLDALAKAKVTTAGGLIDRAEKALLPSHPFTTRLFAAVRSTPPLGAAEASAFCREAESLLAGLAEKGKGKKAKAGKEQS